MLWWMDGWCSVDVAITTNYTTSTTAECSRIVGDSSMRVCSSRPDGDQPAIRAHPQWIRQVWCLATGGCDPTLCQYTQDEVWWSTTTTTTTTIRATTTTDTADLLRHFRWSTDESLVVRRTTTTSSSYSDQIALSTRNLWLHTIHDLISASRPITKAHHHHPTIPTERYRRLEEVGHLHTRWDLLVSGRSIVPSYTDSHSPAEEATNYIHKEEDDSRQ